MCTVTVLPSENDFVLTMNRDERRTRKEDGLRRAVEGGVSFCYPIDAQAGGTWIGVNDRGIAACLLNNYKTPTSRDARSRGEIVSSALACGGMTEVSTFLKDLDVTPYNAFECLVLSLGEIHHFSWNKADYNRQKLSRDKPIMLTSSSERLRQVTQYRLRLFNQWQARQTDDVGLFHLQQQKSQKRSAVFMSRELTHTKSLVQVNVTEQQCQLDYFDNQTLCANSGLLELQSTDSHSMPVVAEQIRDRRLQTARLATVSEAEVA